MLFATFFLQVEEIVPAGKLDPNQIHVSGIYVQKIFQGKSYKKPIEVAIFFFGLSVILKSLKVPSSQ